MDEKSEVRFQWFGAWLGAVVLLCALAGMTTCAKNDRDRQQACARRGGIIVKPVGPYGDDRGCYRVVVTYTPIDTVGAWR